MTFFEPYRYLKGSHAEWTGALQETIRVAGAMGGDIYLAPGWYECAGQLDIADCHNVKFTGPGIIVYTGVATPFIAIRSTTYTKFDGTRIYYNNKEFEGILIQTGVASGPAVANLELNNVTLSGRDGAKSAHALLDLDNANITRIIGGQFAAAHRGIRMSTNKDSATVATNILGASFVGCDIAAIFSWLSSTLESLNIVGCSFGPAEDLRPAGIFLNGTGFVVGLRIEGNWFGDHKILGDPLMTIKAKGAKIDANRCGSAGEYAVYVAKGSEDIYIGNSNVFAGKVVYE